MTDKEQRAAAKAFAEYWSDRGYEKGESQPFWLELLQNVLGIENPAHYIKFEEQVHLDHTSFIDGFIPATHVLIEQKSRDKDLRKPIRQSDGTLLTPFQQAKRYVTELPVSQHPRFIVACNFKEFLIYDMEKPNGEPEEILLSHLPKEYYRLKFLVDTGDVSLKREMEISIQAGNLVGKLYDALLAQYIQPDSEQTLKSLNILCVRLVFCLYAEDAGIFGSHTMFHDYLKRFEARDIRKALLDLFKILDTQMEGRDPYLDLDLATFPYVNGGLFAEKEIEIPQFTEEIVNILLHKASEDFDWSDISPTIFGAVFESTLNPETRRSGGMHYTSIENIHKVIDPLFLDELRAELEEIKAIKVEKIRLDKARVYQEKLATLAFLDPACGSGNFLTETFISLRKLENEAIKLKFGEQIVIDTGDIIRVSIGQFYGIEINDFAVTVAKTALWIAQSQMMKETEDIIHANLDFLPLKSYANITEGNALRMDWGEVVPKEKLNYIMGNPPFVGYKLQNVQQKNDLSLYYKDNKNIDYVSGWYFKASEFMQNTNIQAAFVSTNSITQGEQVAAVWKPLYDRFQIHIDFAYRPFKWNSEANDKAAVHCVIVGFSQNGKVEKRLYDNDRMQIVKNINPYLIVADTLFIQKMNKPLTERPIMVYGSEPREGGFLILSPDERMEVVKETPAAEQFIKRFVSSDDFINNKIRYCLWFENGDIGIVRKSKIISQRLEQCRIFRENSKQKQANAASITPYLFASPRQPKTDYLLIPVVSSERRKYIPIGYLSKNIIASNACFTVSNAEIYHFGILTSNVHNAWMRLVAGRLKSDYRYSNTIVYNTFPFCTPTEEQKSKIEQTAQEILDARALYPNSSLADLYDENFMPPELRKAHQANDRAVMQAYGFDVKTMTESECVAQLMKLYQQLTDEGTA